MVILLSVITCAPLGVVVFEVMAIGVQVLMVETLTYFSTAYLTLYGVLQAIDPALEDAARELDARLELIGPPCGTDVPYQRALAAIAKAKKYKG